MIISIIHSETQLRRLAQSDNPLRAIFFFCRTENSLRRCWSCKTRRRLGLSLSLTGRRADVDLDIIWQPWLHWKPMIGHVMALRLFTISHLKDWVRCLFQHFWVPGVIGTVHTQKLINNISGFVRLDRWGLPLMTSETKRTNLWQPGNAVLQASASKSLYVKVSNEIAVTSCFSSNDITRPRAGKICRTTDNPRKSPSGAAMLRCSKAMRLCWSQESGTRTYGDTVVQRNIAHTLQNFLARARHVYRRDSHERKAIKRSFFFLFPAVRSQRLPDCAKHVSVRLKGKQVHFV